MNMQKLARWLLVIMIAMLVFVWVFWNTALGGYFYITTHSKFLTSLAIVIILGFFITVFWDPILEMDRHGNIINEDNDKGYQRPKQRTNKTKLVF